METYLYKAYAATEELLYVGITHSIEQRFAAHRTTKTWWLSEVSEIRLQMFPTREDAEAAERHQIAALHPKYNELPGVKIHPERRLQDRLTPKSHAKLPRHEIEYLKTLNSEQTYARCAELQMAGWSVTAMLEGAKVAPTPAQLRAELKYRRHQEPTGVEVPQPPKSKSQRLREYREKFEADNYLSEDEKALLKYYAEQSKKYRPQYGLGHPLYQAVEEYKVLITTLRDRGVLFSTIADVVGVNESNIRRRYIK